MSEKVELARFITVRKKKNGAFKVVLVHVFCIDGDVDTTDDVLIGDVSSVEMADIVADCMAAKYETTVNGKAAPITLPIGVLPAESSLAANGLLYASADEEYAETAGRG